MRDVNISNVTVTPASAADRTRGLLAFTSVTINGLVIDGVTVRRTLDGRVVLAFPKRRDRAGRQRSLVHPTNDRVRAVITKAVLAEMAALEERESAR